ncbi:MAG TPA: hypothetical protein VFE15_08385 [Marmoricola sp.]|jgi:hypothetical protein|nr:hypothetical protein [Marmoricola sp.]
MSLLVDATICPDCRAPLDPASSCTGCGLQLTGPLAARLFGTLQTADALVERIRVRGAEVPGAATSLTAELPVAPPLPSARIPARTPGRIPGTSVPAVLLGLGGLCVLVAASVFIAITWGALGLGGRTAVLSGITGLAGIASALMTRRGLRGGAETLWALSAALVTIDIAAARWAGLLGDLAPRHTAGVIGGVLLIGSVVVGAWAGRTSTLRLVGPIGIAGLGAFTATAAEAWTAPHAAVASAIAVPVLTAAALLAPRLAGRVVTGIGYALGAIAVIAWFVLLAQGADRASSDTVGIWWQHFAGWPALAAAAWAAVPALDRRVPEPLRYIASSAALASLVLLGTGGSADAQAEVLVACAVAVVLATVSAVAPLVWARPAGVLTAVAGAVALVATAVRPLAVLTALPTTGPARSPGLGLHLAHTTWTIAPWTAVVIAAVAAITAAGLIRHLPAAVRRTAVFGWIAGSVITVALGAATCSLETAPELVYAVVAWTLLSALGGVATVAVRREPAALITGLAGSAYIVALGLRLAVGSHLLAAVFASAAALVLAVAVGRARTDRLQGALLPLLSGAAVLLAGFAATHWPYVVHATGNTAGLALAGTAALVGIAAARLGRTPAMRISIEATALLSGLAAALFPLDVPVAAITLTVTGAATALVSILHRDRDHVAWVAAVILTTGTVIRLAQHVDAPEALAVPVACVLLAAGIRRLLTDEGVSSRRALSSALSLGLAPSLVLALGDPVSMRGALVGAAGLAVLALGASRRWGAPFVAGAVVTGTLALRHLGPVAEALPRWISLGSVGVLLLGVGITWEARRQDAYAAERYLAALR